MEIAILILNTITMLLLTRHYIILSDTVYGREGIERGKLLINNNCMLEIDKILESTKTGMAHIFLVSLEKTDRRCCKRYIYHNAFDDEEEIEAYKYAREVGALKLIKAYASRNKDGSIFVRKF